MVFHVAASQRTRFFDLKMRQIAFAAAAPPRALLGRVAHTAPPDSVA